MNEQDLRDCYAMFASVGLLLKHGDGYVAKIAEKSYEVADAMLEARKPKEVGIKTVKRTRKIDNET
jgi:hypothetical protein